MSNNNPHRFPRPPTLPQPKIQVKTQRDQFPADSSAPPTFASMVGRASGGHIPPLGIAGGKGESSTPGAFTTSFDLLSIAKVVPAKQRHMSSTTSTTEAQASDAITPGGLLAEGPNIQRDWRKQVPSTTPIGDSPRSPASDISKSMVFRRHTATSSVRARRSTGIFDSDQNKDVKDNQPATVDGLSAWEREDIFYRDETVSPGKPPSPFNNSFETLESSQSEPSPAIDLGHNFSFPVSSPNLLGFDPQGWGDKGETNDHNKDGTRDNLNNAAMDSPAVFKSTKSAPITLSQTPVSPTDFNQKYIPMAPLKNVNDGAGVLRAAAVPFEPKTSNTNSSVSSNQLEGSYRCKQESQMEVFAHLPDNFYREAFSPSIENPLSLSFSSKVYTSSKEQVQWKPDDTHLKLQLAIKHSRGELIGLRSSGDITRKKSSLSDDGISQLWHVHRNGSRDKPSIELPGLTEASSFNHNAQPYSAQGSSFNAKLNKDCTGQIADREPVIPIARNTAGSDLGIVERLELKALDISKSEVDNATNVLHEASFESCLQDQTIQTKPFPKIDQLGRRGAISMQGTARNRLGGYNADAMLKKLTLEAQKKELMEAEGRTTWSKKFLEPTSDIEIRIRNVDTDGKEIGKDWLYPYPRAGSKETAKLILGIAYEQLISYLVPLELKEVKSENDCWRWGLRMGKNKSSCLPGKEPWYNGDTTSFFDMSFGVNRSHTRENTTNPPPGLSSAPISHEQTKIQQWKKTPEELGGLRDLVESSTPDYNDHKKDCHQGHTGTLQEWNSTPIRAHTLTRSVSSRVGAVKEGTSSHLWTGDLNYENKGKEINDSLGDAVSNKEIPRSATFTQKPRSGSIFGVGVGTGSLGVTHGIGPGGNELDGIKKSEVLMFGSDEESE